MSKGRGCAFSVRLSCPGGGGSAARSSRRFVLRSRREDQRIVRMVTSGGQLSRRGSLLTPSPRVM